MPIKDKKNKHLTNGKGRFDGSQGHWTEIFETAMLNMTRCEVKGLVAEKLKLRFS